MFNKIIFFSLTAGLVFGLSAAAYRPAALAADVVKIGIVDIQRVINTSAKGQAAKKKLIAKFDRMQKELQLRKAEIEKSKIDLERQASVLDPGIRYDKEKTLKRKMRDFEDQYRDYQEIMKRDEFENTQPMLNAIAQVIEKLGKERGFTVILEKRAVIYYPEAIELTEEIKELFDANK